MSHTAPLQRIAASQRRLWIAILAATVAIVGAHLGLLYAVTGELDPLVIAIDAGTALVVLAATATYLPALAGERRRRVVERLLLDLLAAPRNIEETAREALRLLSSQDIGDMAMIAIAGDGDAALRPVASSGMPKGWREAMPAPTLSREGTPSVTRAKPLPSWLEGARTRVGDRPWVAQVPLRSGLDPIGLLLVVAKRPGALSDPAILELLATRIGAAIDHAALYEAAYARERDLEEMEARRREFIAAIAHEIRTPLTAIQAFADLLHIGQQEMDETAGHLVSSLGHGVQRLSSLVDDLIDLGRSGSTGYTLQRREVDLSAVIRSAETTLRPALMLREQAVTLDLPAEGPIALSDQRVLEQVIVNLLSNANRHSPAGGSITISAHRLDTSTVRIEVTDSGPGIPEGERDRIFQPYYRVRRDDAVPGSGLGLAIARRLLHESGGRIWAEAPDGGGARFCVEVRAAPVVSLAEPS